MNNKNEDRYWTVKEIRHYVIKFLKESFPDSIIEREFDKVDIMVHGPMIPVEIQRTIIQQSGTPAISQFEDRIRRQIEQNISIFDICWLFFDTKLLYYLQNILYKRNVSINMDWIYQFFKAGKLKIFTITIKGIIKELEDKDFEFIREFSNTCILSNEDHHRILERNKSKIAYNIYKKKGFTTEEINKLYVDYENDITKTKNIDFKHWLWNKDGRIKELGYIRNVFGLLMQINYMLKCEMQDRHAIQFASTIGIIEGNDLSGGKIKFNRIRCVDNYNILEYFPGYHEKKELWDFWRIHTVAHKTFMSVIRGEYPNYLKDYNKQQNIEDSWGSI